MQRHEPMTQLPAGKFEFPDMGIYIGEWFESKAVGLGLMTREKGQGEYTGYWNNGKEECGVFLWPNAPGAMYQGDWAHSKRHGHGIFRKEDYMIMGEFRDDIIKTGVSCREGGGTKFEGDFKEGLPIFGVETYPDGGTYCGEYESAKRQGYGKRTSIAYGEMVGYYPDEAARFENRRRRDSLTSQGSGGSYIGGGVNDHINPHMTPLSARRAIRSNAPLSQTRKFRCGFVLPGNKSDLLVKRLRKEDDKRSRAKSQSMSSVLSSKLLRRKSTDPFRRRTNDGSFRSAYSAVTSNTIGSTGTGDWQAEDPIEPETIECYAGEWWQDERHGHGVCKRSDGVIYEGQWQHNLRHGYGVTHFPDGTLEAGRYQHGQLGFLAGKRNPLLFIYTFPINKTIELSVKKARDAEQIAEDKFREAQSKLAEVRDMVQRAKASATAASEYSLETRELVKELYPDFDQPGVRILETTVKMMKLTKRISTAFETALRNTIAVLSGENLFYSVTGEPIMMDHAGNILNRCDSLHKGSPNMKRSRHGSFRASFRHKRQAGGTDGGVLTLKGQKPEPGVTVVRQAAVKVKVSEARKKKKHHSAGRNTLMVPDIMNGDDGQEFSDGDLEETIVPNTMKQTNLMPPGIQIEDDEVDGMIMIEAISQSNDDYVESETQSILEVEDRELPCLDPHSDIPTVPFNELLNSTVLSDHFDFYAYNDAQIPEKNENADLDNISSAIIFGKSPPKTIARHIRHDSKPSDKFNKSKKRPAIPQQKTQSSMAPVPNSSTANRQISRTRTLPSLLTCEPVNPKSILTLRNETIAEKQLIVEVVLPVQSPSSTTTVSEKPLYLVENGVRKRAQPQWIDSSVRSSSPFKSTSTTLAKPFSTKPESFLFQPQQDKLTQLSKTYRIESEYDLRKDLGEGSLPDMSMWKRLQEKNAFNDAEIERLMNEYQQSQLEDTKRRRQGEIIIHMTNLLDWCYQHVILLIVILINSLLTFFFYCIIVANEPKS